VVRLLPPLILSRRRGRRDGGQAGPADLRASSSHHDAGGHEAGNADAKHYLQFKDLRAEEYAYLFERTRASSRRASRTTRSYQPLADRTLAMIFEKASTRTRRQLRGRHVPDGRLGGAPDHRRQPARPRRAGRGRARVISRMVDLVMIRTYEQSKIERFAAHSRVPVINGLTNEYHPCQILADVFTYIEHRGSIAGKVVAWVGDGNNMANTWLQAAEILGFTVHVSTPRRLRGRPARWPASPTQRC
jgi:ornithine carbamoyltransferase